MTSSHRHRTGFTIVELLVVISIMAVLMGLLLPALSGAQRRGRKATELNDLRQIGIAWNLYAQSNRDAALPGFLDGVHPGPEGLSVQERWKVRYDYANGTAASLSDAQSWPWRLLQYLDYSDEMVLGHLDLDVTGPQAMSDPTLQDPVPHRGPGATIARTTRVAEEPSFAYNAFYVGGWYDQWLPLLNDDKEITGYVPRPRYGGQVTANYYSYNGDVREGPFETTASVVVRSPAQIRNASNLILFCSASRMPLGDFHEVEADRFGSHFVVPPYLATEPMWRKSPDTPSDTTLQVRGTVDGQDAPVPIGRHTGAVASLRADLRTDASAPGTLDDQRLWIDRADTKLWYHNPD